jgi:hypothetical protein
MFERRSGGMVPTPMGAIVIERTRAALDHLPGAKGLSAVFQYPERLMTMTQLRAFRRWPKRAAFPPPPMAAACRRPPCIARSAIWNI